MNHFLPTKCRVLAPIFAAALLAGALLAGGLMPTAESAAQSSGYRASGYQESGYQAPVFARMGAPSGGSAQLIPSAFPASMLAGGPAAAQGGEFMDVQGRQIELTNYCPSCPQGGGYPGGGYCGPGAGGYGDPMAVDFGGYGQDQCGPHYFDVQVGAVFLRADDTFGGAQAFTSIGRGLNAPRVLDGANTEAEYEAGWEIAARYDIGALAVLEATYMGIYDMGFSESVNSVDVAPGGANFQLFGPPDFGTGLDIPGIDQGQTHAFNYEADLQSAEFSYRRYWVGNNPRVSGTYLVGARYLRFTDAVVFNSSGFGAPELETVSLSWTGENDLVGAQLGGDAWMSLRQGLRVGVEGTAGIYNNRFKFNNSGTFSAANAPDDFAAETEGNHVAFATEWEVSMVADILPSWSLRGGYRVLYMDRLATGAGNINQASLTAVTASPDGDLLFHGFHGGVEYVW